MFGPVRNLTHGIPGSSLFKGVLPAIATLAFIIYISYLGWMSLGPEKPIPDEKRQAVAGKAVDTLREELREGRGNINTAVLIHFANDTTDFISDSLRNALNYSGVLALEDRTFSEKIRNKLNLVNRGCANRKEALKAGRDAGTDGVLWGVIERFESFPGGAIVKGRWELLETATGAVRVKGIIDEDSTPKEPLPEKKTVGKFTETTGKLCSFGPLPLRIAGFLLCVLMLPVVSFTFIRSHVAKGSNKGNAIILGVLTFIDMLLAFLLVSGAFAAPAGVFLFLGGSAAGFFYNASMMRFAKKLEE